MAGAGTRRRRTDSQLGAFGSLAIGLRRNILEAFVRERVSLKVLETTRISLTRSLQPGVMARDVFHHIVGRALMTEPQFLVLDEPSMGLAPAIVQLVFEAIDRLHQDGQSILLVEQDAEITLSRCDYAYVMNAARSSHPAMPPRCAPTRRSSTPISHELALLPR